MKKLLGIFLAAVAMFVFGAVYWMNPLSASFIMKVHNDETAGRQLKSVFTESGTYFIPSNQGDNEKFIRLYEAGPVAMVHINVDGQSPMSPTMMIIGFVHGLIAMFVAAAVMGSMLALLKTYTRRVGFMMVIGGLIAWYGNLSNAIWWFNSWEFSIVVAIHTLLAWTVGGLVLAAFIKPNSTKSD
jgi:hypothetical protein